MVGAARAGVDPVVINYLLAAILLTVIACGGAFFYLLFKDPDALRSEKYTLTKMAIERAWIGDDTTGAVDIVDLDEMIEESSKPRDKEDR